MRRVMSWEAYEKGRCHQVIHDGNCEFITLIICISALSIAIPPVLLYKGASRDLQDIGRGFGEERSFLFWFYRKWVDK
jgi:hypothetical protein